jgi:hypothetical protein
VSRPRERSARTVEKNSMKTKLIDEPHSRAVLPVMPAERTVR